MKIQIGGLSEGIHRYRFEATSQELGLGEKFKNKVVVEATLDKMPNQIVLKGDISATGVFACDRCVMEFKADLRPSYQMCYITEGDDYRDVDPVEMQFIPPGLHVIDITEDVRQTVLLAIPLKLLCSESCAGLCPHCGINLNEAQCTCSASKVDPRWEKLRKFQSN